MLIEYGNTITSSDWHLEEQEATAYLRVYYVHDGMALYEAKNQSHKMTPGNLYVLPDSVPYRTSRLGEKPFVCTYLHVSLHSVQINGLIELPVTEGTSLYHYASLVQELINENKIDLLEHVAEQIGTYCKTSEYYTCFSEFLLTVRQYVYEHISEKITIEQLSALFHYHPNYFIDVFKRETGCTPYQYILKIRMQQALVLLRRNNNLTVAAQRIGYADAGSFTRAFVRFYGITPGVYQERWKHGYNLFP